MQLCCDIYTMDINGIVLQLYQDRRVKEFISRQQPADLQQDLLHHCILEIYRMHEVHPGKIEKLFNDGKLWPYFHGMACMQLKSKTSTFFRRFRRTFEPEEMIPAMIEEPKDIDCKEVDKDFVEYVYSVIERPKKESKSNFHQIDMF